MVWQRIGLPDKDGSGTEAARYESGREANCSTTEDDYLTCCQRLVKPFANPNCIP
jgi:hypothetical protein